MKNVWLQLEKNESLTKEQMKQIVGGQAACYTTINSSCGGGGSIMDCHGASADTCQQAADRACAGSDCCDDVDCRDIIF